MDLQGFVVGIGIGIAIYDYLTDLIISDTCTGWGNITGRINTLL